MAGGILDFEGKKFTNKHLATHKNITKAKEVTFLDTSIDDEGLLFLKNCKNLTSIYVDSDIVTGEFVPQLEGMKKIESLQLIGKKLGKRGFEIPVSIQETLTCLSYENGVSDLDPLLSRSFPEVEDLRFFGNEFSDKAIKLAQSCGKLTAFFLAGAKVTGKGIESIPNNSGLILSLAETSITDETIKNIGENLSELTQLRVQYCNFSGKNLKALKACTKLIALDLSFTTIEPKYLRDLVFLPESCEVNFDLSTIPEEDRAYILKKRPDLDFSVFGGARSLPPAS